MHTCKHRDPCGPPVPIAELDAEFLHKLTGVEARSSPAIQTTRPISDGPVRKARHSAKRSGSQRGCSIRCSAIQIVAFNVLADGLSRTIAKHGSGAIAFYLSGQLLTEDYYVANKLTKGFLGSANVDTNSRLCMASTVAGHRRAFGSDTVPGVYADLDSADLIALVGSNAAWCHPLPS